MGQTLLCGCNRVYEDHDAEVIRRFKQNGYREAETEWAEWKEGFTIDDGPTDAYGDVVFLGSEKKAKVRLF